MAQNFYTLPKDDEALCDVIENHVQRERAKAQFRRVMWRLWWAYLQGARNFDVVDMETGRLSYRFVDNEGKLLFQAGDLLRAIDQSTGRLASLDLSPYVTRNDTTLASIRERAVGQVMADHGINPSQLEQIKLPFSNTLVTTGCCGIQSNIVETRNGPSIDLEIVHPLELLPFPSLGIDNTKTSGIIRSRLVPLDELRSRYGAQKVNSNLDKLRWISTGFGQSLADDHDDTAMTMSSWNTTSGSSSPSKDETPARRQGLARVHELYLYGPQNNLARYITISGKVKFADEIPEGDMPCPLQKAVLIENGSFHGAGLCDVLFGYNREMEKLLQHLWQSITDTDRYGVIVMPRGTWNKQTALKDVGRGLRVLDYSPDVNLPENNFRPFPITPFTQGEVPGRAAALAKQMSDQLNPIRDLISQKGRVDSASGLQFLEEQINSAVTTSTLNIERAFGTAYKSGISRLAHRLTTERTPLRLERLDLSLAGVVVDTQNWTASFDVNPLPDVSRLRFSIRENKPRSETGRIQGAMELVKNGLSDPLRFIAQAVKEGWDLPMWTEDYQNSYRTIVRSILTLYNDGETPGELVVTPELAKPEFQLMILTSFMSSPQMHVASVDVVEAFQALLDTYRAWMGNVLPAGVPNPDDLVSLAQGPIPGMAPGQPPMMAPPPTGAPPLSLATG